MAKRITQQELARLTGLSQQKLSQLQRSNVWHPADTLIQANKKIMTHLDTGWRSVKTNQTELAAWTGLSQQRISQFQKQAIVDMQKGVAACLHALIAHLGEVKGAHKSDSGLDLVHERARLSRFMADKVAIEIKRMIAELMPVEFTKEILGTQHSNIRSRVLGIPNEFRVKFPQAPTAEYLALKEICHGVLTALSHARFPSELDERIKQHFRDIFAAAESDSNGVGG